MNEKCNQQTYSSTESQMGVFITDSLSISGESLMPESCMDCRLQNSCMKIPRWAEANTLRELYLSRRSNCPLIEISAEDGRWNMNEFREFICSVCGETSNMKTKFCPNCGRRMKVENE